MYVLCLGTADKSLIVIVRCQWQALTQSLACALQTRRMRLQRQVELYSRVIAAHVSGPAPFHMQQQQQQQQQHTPLPIKMSSPHPLN